ncbi:hypothetical protein PAXINDRAFT_178961 [Paxillus involutus ATCC 200175]|nr:hypothetical protein PAXINDRAFT_178961 [Paxillus involutus ATCC 200175]
MHMGKATSSSISAPVQTHCQQIQMAASSRLVRRLTPTSPILSSPNQPTQTHRRHGPYPIIIGCPQQAGGNVPAQMTTFWGFVGRPVVAVLYDDLMMFNGFICQTTFGRAIYATTKNSLGRMEIISTGIDGTPVALAPGTIATRVVLSAQQAVESKESRLEICDVLHATHDPLVGLTLDLQRRGWTWSTYAYALQRPDERRCKRTHLYLELSKGISNSTYCDL